MERQFGFTRNWKIREGMVYGLLQPAIVGRLVANQLPDATLDQLESWLARLLDRQLPELQGDGDNAARLGHRLAFLIGAVQRRAGVAVSETYYLGNSRPVVGYDSITNIALPYLRPKAVSRAIQWVEETVTQILNQLASGVDPVEDDLQTRFAAVQRQLHRYSHRQFNVFDILCAADRLRIPVQWLDDRVVSLGTGCNSRWLFSSITDRTPGLGVDLAHDKFRTASVLSRAGLPGVRQKRVTGPEEAVRAAEELEYPVVIKPADQEQGEGVYADLRTASAVIKAYEAARKVSGYILVEKWVAGQTHRLTVFQNQVVRASRRRAGGVTGDGVHNVADLVALWQSAEENQRRSWRLGRNLLELDDEAMDRLAQEGLDSQYVPQQGEYVQLRRRDNMNTGGTNEYIDCAQVHPDNLQLARDVATVFRMDFVGVDLITTDIGRSWRESGAVICEINAQPQLGNSQDEFLFDRILTDLMGSQSSIPARLCICSEAEEGQLQILAGNADPVKGKGVSHRAGIWLDGRKHTGGFKSGFHAAQALLVRSDVKEATCLMTPREVVTFGVPLNRWDSVSVLNEDRFEPEETSIWPTVKTLLQAHITSGKVEI